MRSLLLAVAFLTTLALTNTLARCSAFAFAMAIATPFCSSCRTCAISLRHLTLLQESE